MGSSNLHLLGGGGAFHPDLKKNGGGQMDGEDLLRSEIFGPGDNLPFLALVSPGIDEAATTPDFPFGVGAAVLLRVTRDLVHFLLSRAAIFCDFP